MNLSNKIIKNRCICSFCRHFCVKIQKILSQSLLLTLPKQFPTECKQIKIKKNVKMPAKIVIIYRLQGHIHGNLNAEKVLFYMSYNKNPVE